MTDPIFRPRSAKAALQLLALPTASECAAALPLVFQQIRDGQPMNQHAWSVLVQAVRQDRLFFITSSDSLDHPAQQRRRQE